MALTTCSEIVQKQLLDLTARQTPFSRPTGAVDLALSAENGAEVQAQMIKKNGKNSTYSIEYPNALCEAVGECSDTDFGCDDIVEPTMTGCQTITGFECVKTKWIKMDIANLRDLGLVTGGTVFAHQVMSQMDLLIEEIDKQAIISAVSSSNAGSSVLQLLDQTTGAPVYQTADIINLDFADNGYSTTPLILGNRQVYQYANILNKLGMTNGGVNLGSMDRFPAFYDRLVTATNAAPVTPGNDVLLAFMPGVFNLLHWSENAGVFATRMDSLAVQSYDPLTMINTDGRTYEYATITHPTKMWTFDIDIEFRNTNCEKGIYWQLKSYYKPFVLPLNHCNNSETGIKKYDVCPQAAVTCS